MKRIILLLYLSTIFLFSQSEIQPDKKFYIEKNNQGGYNIYDADKELLYEYTAKNIDSTTLRTIQNIFDRTIIGSENVNKPLLVMIENIPEPETGLLEIFKIVISTVAGGLILFGIQYFTQIKQNRKQEFENRINSYLEHQQNILNDIRPDVNFAYHGKKHEGREFFIFSRKYIRDLYDFLFWKHATVANNTTELQPHPITRDELFRFYRECPYRNEIDSGKYEASYEKELEISRRIYEFYFRYYKDYIGHYFRHLYNILDYISEKKKIFGKKSKEPRFLADMIQARLSAAELFLLFYNSLMPAFINMNLEVRSYNVIENLAKEDLLNSEIHSQFYLPDCKMKSLGDLRVPREPKQRVNKTIIGYFKFWKN